MMLAAAETEPEHEIIPVPGSARSLDGTPADLTRPLCYPVKALCQACGRPVRCERWLSLSPGDPGSWVHDEHEVTPIVGSARDLDGVPASLSRPLDYPVEALCSVCGRPARCERWLSVSPGDAGSWRHVDRFSVPPR